MSRYAQTFEALLTSQRASGVTLSGGKAYFYIPGTTTTKAIYTDRNKTTPAANPYTLSADGTAQIFGDGLYDVKITNSAGVQKFIWEDVKIQDPTGEIEDCLSNYSSFSAAVSSIGSTSTALKIDIDANVSTDVTVPSTLILIPDGIHIITVSSGKSLTINSQFDPDPFHCFSTASSVIINKSKAAYPEWWGADNTGVLASSDSFNSWGACGCKNLKCMPGASYKIKNVVLPGTSGINIDFNFCNIIADGSNVSPATACFTVTFDASSTNSAYWFSGWKFNKVTLLSGYAVDFLVVNIINSALLLDLMISNIKNRGCKQGTTDPMNALIKINKTSSMTPESVEISHLNNNGGGLVDYMVHVVSDSTSEKGISGNFHHMFQNVNDLNARVIYFDNCGVSRSTFDMLYNAGGTVFESPRTASCSFSRIYQEALLANSVVMKGTYQYCDFKQITTIRQPDKGGEKLFYGTMYECVWESCEHTTGIVDAVTGSTGLGTTKTITLLPGSQYNIIKDVWSTLTTEGHQYWAAVDDQGSNNWYGDRPKTGTYIPTVSVTGATVTLDAAYTLVYFKREYDTVRVSGILKIASINGTPSGSLTISLPYSCSSGNSQSTSMPIICTGFAAGMTSPANAHVDPGSNQLVVSGFSAGSLVNIGAHIQSNGYIRLGGYYTAKRDFT